MGDLVSLAEKIEEAERALKQEAEVAAPRSSSAVGSWRSSASSVTRRRAHCQIVAGVRL